MANAVMQTQMHPELLEAANRGNWSSLGDLLSEEVASVPQVIVDIDEDDGEPPVKRMHAYGPDSVLHVVASGGDDEKFLRSATLIYDKAKHLLGTCNAAGDTPLHCAARAGSVKMLTHLVSLAMASREDDDGGSKLQLVLRKHNHRGETALHEAVRLGDEDMVGVLMRADKELARFPRANGASPLYLAVLLGRQSIAEQLYRMDKQLSYSGPDGQNALHVAVLRNDGLTQKLLAWNKILTKQGDRSRGWTPLHFVASVRPFIPWSVRSVDMLLNTDKYSPYQSDNNGSFPIHVAALHKNFGFIRILLQNHPNCAQLRDGQGRTFLHITAENCDFPVRMSIRSLLLQGNQVGRFAAILNAQDDEGNTALHYAVMSRRPRTVRRLIWNKEIQLNLQNRKGQTAMDLSWSNRPSMMSSILDPNTRIFNLLKSVDAKYGIYDGGNTMHAAPPLNETVEAKKIKESTTTIAVASVFIVTVSFAAAFQLPGGYTTGNKPEGTPELAKNYSFQAFLLANNLAFGCGAISTISLMYAGMAGVDTTIRRLALWVSVLSLNSSARSLAAAFVLGSHAVLAPVAHAASVLTWLSLVFLLADIACISFVKCIDHLILINRLGVKKACWRVTITLTLEPLWFLWPYVVIGCFIAYLKARGIH